MYPLNNGQIAVSQATEQLLDLFSVVGSKKGPAVPGLILKPKT